MTDARVYTGYGEVLVKPFSGAVLGSHRYWRLLISANDGYATTANEVAIGEIEFRATSGGADLTNATDAAAGAATADSSYAGAYYPDYAFNDASTGWWSATGSFPHWIKYDFGSAVAVTEVTVKAYTSYPTAAPSAFAVQWSDDNSAWTTAWSITGQTGWTEAQVRTFTAPSAVGDIAARTYTGYAETLLKPYSGGTDTQTVLLCHFDGVNGATSTTDSSPSARTLTMQPSHSQLSTAQAKFGTTSMQSTAGGLGYALVASGLTDFQFGAGQFTVEAWVYLTSNSAGSDYVIAGNYSGTGPQLGWIFGLRGSELRFYYSTDGTSGTSTIVGAAWTPTLNQWYHVAVDRDASNVVRVYLNGAVHASATVSATLWPSTNDLYLGNDGNLGRGWPGYIDELRISKGVARYGGAFTPPTQAFSTTVAGDIAARTYTGYAEVLIGTYEQRIAKSYALAVLGIGPGVALPKAYGLAVLSYEGGTGTINISQTIQSAITWTVAANEVDVTRLRVPKAGRLSEITYYAGSTALVGRPIVYLSSAAAGSIGGTVGTRVWMGSEVTVPTSGTLAVTPDQNLYFDEGQEIFVGFFGKTAGQTYGYTRVDKNAAGTALSPTYYIAATYPTSPAGPWSGTAYTNAMALKATFTPGVNTDRTLAGQTALSVAAANTFSNVADEITVRQITLPTCSVNKLKVWGNHYAAYVGVKPVIYTDSSNYPGTLVQAGPAASIYPGENDLPFASDVSLSAGTYWIGHVSNGTWTSEATTPLTGATKYKTVAGQYATPPTTYPASGSTATVYSAPVMVSYSVPVVTNISVSTVAAYAVTGTAAEIGVSNLAAYAVTGTAAEIGVSNLAAYAVYDPGYVPVSSRRPPVIAFIG